jgi:hypothetical protein
MVNSLWDAQTDEVAAFEELVGSHGGLGGGQSHPFVLHPVDLPMPTVGVLGAESLHDVFRGWLDALGHGSHAERTPVGTGPDGLPDETGARERPKHVPGRPAPRLPRSATSAGDAEPVRFRAAIEQ